MGEEIHAAAIEGGRGNDVPALPHQGDDRQVQRGMARGGGDGTDAQFEARDPFLQHRHRRIGNAAVDVAGPLQVEQPRGVIAVFENVGCRLIDRDRPGAGGRVDLLPAVQRQGVEFQELGIGHPGASFSRDPCRDPKNAGSLHNFPGGHAQNHGKEARPGNSRPKKAEGRPIRRRIAALAFVSPCPVNLPVPGRLRTESTPVKK